MRLWKVETASGFAYVQAPSEEMAFAYAEGQYGKGNVTGAQPAKGTQDPAIGSPIIAQTDGGVQVVGRYQGGGNLNSLSAFAASYDGDTFARNLAQNPYYAVYVPSKVPGMAAPNNYDPDADATKRPDIEEGNDKNPFLPEQIGGANVAFDRALQSIGYDKGVLGSIGRSKFSDLNALAMLGQAAGRDTDMFQNLGAGREMQDFFAKALGRLSGGRDPGAAAVYDLPTEATALFNEDVGVDSGLYNFYNPQIGMGKGRAGVGEDLSGYDAALLAAQLGLAGLGAKRFGGAFSSMLPSAQTLVSDFSSQPIDSPTAQTDIRAYIRDRLTK